MADVMWDEMCEPVAADPRPEWMREWVDLDSEVSKLEQERKKIEARLSELRPKRSRLGQKIADVVHPQDKPCDVPASDFVKGVTDW